MSWSGLVCLVWSSLVWSGLVVVFKGDQPASALRSTPREVAAPMDEVDSRLAVHKRLASY